MTGPAYYVRPVEKADARHGAAFADPVDAWTHAGRLAAAGVRCLVCEGGPFGDSIGPGRDAPRRLALLKSAEAV